MKTLQEFLEEQFDQEMMLAVLSGQSKKDADVPSKVRIRPVEIKGTVCYQATATVGQKAIHKNYTHEEVTHLHHRLPRKWFFPASDTGTAQRCFRSCQQEG